MGFALADIFVNIGANDKTGPALARLKSSVSNLHKSLQALGAYAQKALIGIAAAGTYAAKAFGDAEESENNLKAALQATGQEVTNNLSHMTAYAQSMQTLTGINKEQIMSLQEQATNLGVTADQMDDVTKAAVGLGTALFHGDIEEGLQAINKAKSGNFRELERKLPQLKNPNLTNEQKWDVVMKISTQGWDEAQAKTKTFYGQLGQLSASLKTAAEGFGSILAPQLAKVSAFLQGVTIWLQKLTPEQKAQVVKWMEIAAAIAALIAFGPAIVTFVGTIASAFVTMATTVGAAIAFLVTEPIGWLLAGLAGLAIGFAYLAGSGDSATSRIIDGFMKIVEFLDHMLGSWEGFKQGALVIWDALKYEMLAIWLGLEAKMESMWANMVEGFKAAWYLMAGAVADWATQVWGVIRGLGESISHYWDKMIDYIATKMASIWIKHQARKDVDEQYGGKKIGDKEINQMAAGEQMAANKDLWYQAKQNVSTQHPDLTGRGKQDAEGDEFRKLSQDFSAKAKARLASQYKGRELSDDELAALEQKEVDARLASQQQMQDTIGRQKQREYEENLAGIDQQIAAQRKSIQDWRDKGLVGAVDQNQAAQQKIKAEQDANQKELEAKKAALKKEYDDYLKNTPKLSDKVKDAYDKIKKSLGLDGFDFGKAIQDQKDKAAGIVGKGGPGPMAHNAPAGKDVTFTGIEDVMKRNLAAALLGKAASDPIKIAAQQLAAQKAANAALKAIKDNLHNLPAALASLMNVFL